MLLRSVLLALVMSALVSPVADAAVFGDRLVPIHDASDGVRVDGSFHLRFGSRAAKLYRPLAGKRVLVTCGDVSTDVGVSTDSAETLPRRRTAARVPMVRGHDICTLSTRNVKDEPCMPPSSSQDRRCARINVALTDAGRARLDALARTVDLATVFYAPGPDEPGQPVFPYLQKFFGDEVSELAGPDDSPPPGKVGVWAAGTEIVISTRLRDGTRRFVGQRGGVFSTNDAAFFGPQEDAFGIF